MYRAAGIVVVLVGGCEHVLNFSAVEPMYDGRPSIDGPPVPPPCTASAFGSGSIDTVLFGSASTSALTVDLNGTLFVAEDASGSANAVYRRDASGSRNDLVAPPAAGDELAEPTMDPEANVMYVRDKTAMDAIIPYALVGDVFQTSTQFAVPVGHRAGNQTLDLGGFRRMVVQFPASTNFEFNEYEGSPLAGWTLHATYQPPDLLTAGATYIVDPAIDANGLNLVFVGMSGVYVSHRTSVDQAFPKATQLMAGDFSTPVLGSSCRTLYVVDKPNQVAHRYQNP